MIGKTNAGGGGGFVISSTTPVSTNVLWIDTANDNILKYYDATTLTWIPVTGAWG
jgi:hypothetical protein